MLFKQGRELLEQAKKQASQKKTPYTDMETECLLNAYLLNHADMEKARTVFFREFPNSNHSKASVWQKISRIRTLDNLFPQDTECIPLCIPVSYTHLTLPTNRSV